MRADDRGLTLVEVLVSASVFLLAIAMFGGALIVAQRMQVRSGEYSRANDQAQLALSAIDRQVRSGYVAQVLGVGSWYDSAVKIYTEAGGRPMCVMWAVITPTAGAPAELYTTRWDPTTGATAPTSFTPSQWTKAATDLWNYVPPTNVTVFTQPLSATTLLPVLSVAFRINGSTRSEATIEIGSVFTSRNVPRKLEQIPGGPLVKETAC